MYFEELNSGESSVPLWSTGPTWDFGRKVFGFSTIEFIAIKLPMYTGPSESWMTAEALGASVSLGVGGPVSFNRDNLTWFVRHERQTGWWRCEEKRHQGSDSAAILSST